MLNLPPEPRLLLEGNVAAGAQYIGIARKLAKRAYQSGIRAKTWQVAAGVVVRVENYLESRLSKVYVRAFATALNYQFIGTPPVRYQDFLDDAFLLGARYLPRVYAVLAKHSTRGWSAKPLVTSLEEPPNPEDWVFDIDPRNTNDHLYITPAHQPDGFGIHPFFTPTVEQPDKSYPWLGTQWAQALPLHAFARWSAGAVSGHFAPADIDYDYPPVVYTASTPRTGAFKRPDTDWHQRGCLRVVDGRTFIIVADVDSVFHCFPLGAETGDGRSEPNIPGEVLQSVACPWPAWVTVEDLGADVSGSQITRLRPRWVFAQDGTRAACIAAHRDEPWADATYTSSLYSAAGAYQYDVREDYPGLVEVGFAISISGEGLGDFTFSVTLRQTVYSVTTGRYPIAAGYAMRAMGDAIPLDTLLVMEYQFYTNNPAMSAEVDPLVEITPLSPTVEPEDGWRMPERPAFAAVAKVFAQADLESSWVEVREWLAYYCVYPTRKTYGINRKEPRPFYPRIEEIPDVPYETDWYDNHFEFITQLTSVDLSSMAFCMSATLATYGAVLPSNTAYAADAARVEVIVWNELKETSSVGYDFLKPVVNEYLHLLADYPDLSSMSRIYPNATLDYTYYGMVQHSSGVGDFDTATLTVRDGHIDTETTWESVLARGYAVAGLSGGELAHYSLDVAYSAFSNSSLFFGSARIYLPWVYLFFDTGTVVRPGFRWTKDSGRDIQSSTWEAGSASFTNFPYGITLANKIYNLTIIALGNINAGIQTHVNGSWSIFYGPFACQRDVVNYSTGIPLDHEQGIIDKIVIVDKNNEHTSNHISLLNSAFNRNWTVADYYFTFRKVGSQPQFNPKIIYPTELGWFDVINVPLSVLWVFESIVGMYLIMTTGFNSFVSIGYAYGSPVKYSFPTPRLESLFLGSTK